MQGVIKKFLYSALALFLALNTALAIDNEYKNSLTKIELSKKDDNSYNIDLFTQKKYSEPVKVIKKSDLSYYILLPETKNSSTSVSGVADVKNVSTNSYYYAGQNKNGYTKININTSKPVNFNVNVKSLSAVKNQQKQAQKALQVATAAKATVREETSSAQKKNSTSPNLKKPIEVKKTAVVASVPVKKAVTYKQETKKATPIKNKVKKIAKSATSLKKPVVAVTSPKTQTKEVFETIDKEVQQEVETDVEKGLEKNDVALDVANSLTQEENQNVINDEPQEAIDTSYSENQAEVFLYKIYNKILPYKKLVKALLLSVFIILSFSLLILFIVLIIPYCKNKNKRARKSDKLIPFSMNGREKQSRRKEDKQKNDGQYFILKNNVAKNNFENSLKNKKHYELSSYEPDIQVNYKNQKPSEDFSNNENDYDIIRKILKEDSLIDYMPDEINSVNKINQTQQKVAQQCEELKVKKEVKKPKVIEPTVLSSVEIAPERGFMCVSYNDNINLIGYIFDDVFALYNFKCPKLENYDIKYRLTDKDDKGANFIVKVENYKMVVRVTKSFMSLEVLM